MREMAGPTLGPDRGTTVALRHPGGALGLAPATVSDRAASDGHDGAGCATCSAWRRQRRVGSGRVARLPSTWRVYMLRCRDGTLYTGATNDLARRLERHSAGQGARYTRSRLPVKLVYLEPSRDCSAALRREAALKRLTRRDKLALIRTSCMVRGAA